MNKGIAMARGDILGILNVDDYYEPNTLKRVQEIFESLPEPSMVVGNCNVWDDSQNLLFVNKPSRLRISDLLLGWSFHPHPVNPSAYFYHASIHKILGPYDENDHYSMDLDFLFRAVRSCNVVYVDETWGNYRLIKGTKTFEDKKIGNTEQRRKDLRVKYLMQLPIIQRYRILFMYKFLTAKKRIKNRLRTLAF
jgi:glycosyltransferase involved in cell wall biosynthesis